MTMNSDVPQIDLSANLPFFQQHYQDAAEKLFRVILPRARVNAVIVALPSKPGLRPLIHLKEPTLDIADFASAQQSLSGASSGSRNIRQLIRHAYESNDKRYKTRSFNRSFATKMSSELGYIYCPAIQIPTCFMEEVPCVDEAELKEMGMPGSLVEAAMDTIVYDAYRVLMEDDPRYYFRAFSDMHSLARSSAIGFVNSFCRLLRLLVDPHRMYDSLNEISSAPYEGQESLGSIVFSESSALKDLEFIKFERPIPLDKHKWVRKIIHMSSQDLFAVHDQHNIIGLGRGKLTSRVPQQQPIKIEFSGAHKWQLSRGQDVFMKVYLGMPTSPAEALNILETQKIITEKFSLLNSQDSVLIILDKIRTIVEESTKKRHGTMLVIAPPMKAQAEARRLGQQAIQIEPSTSNYLILQASRIDGAIFLDTQGKCHAVGVILDGIARPDAGEDSARGARYNSAVRYANSNQDCLILVISEDGYMNFVPTN